MAYAYGRSKKAPERSKRVEPTRAVSPNASSDRPADGFNDGWSGEPNGDGTRNSGRADLDGLLAYIMFHGREVLDAEPRANRFRGTIVVDERSYRVPLAGILAAASLRGRKVLEANEAEGTEKFSWPGPWELDSSSGKQKSQQDRVNKMLSGAAISPGWLVQLAAGLEMEAQATDSLWRLFGATRAEGTVPDARRIEDFLRRHVDLQSQRKQNEAESAAAAARRHSRTADYALFDAFHEATKRLDASPHGYPDALSVRVLADKLRATSLEHGWEREYEKVHRLYSGFHGYGMHSAMELISKCRDVVVLGDPGHGKSTLLAGLALQAVDQGSPVVYARLDDLGRVAAEDSFQPSKWNVDWAAEMVLEAAIASGLVLKPEIRRKAIETLTTEPDFVVVLDGWDEVSTEEHRLAAERALQILTGTWTGVPAREEGMAGKFIIASRVTGYRRPVPGISEVLVTLMDPSTVEGFFESWFEGENNDEGLRRVQKALTDQRLAEVARIPVLAGFIAVVAQDEEPRTTKHGLYEQYLRRFLVRAWRGGRFIQRNPSEIDKKLGIATAVAWKMATWPTKDPHRVDQWEDNLSADQLGAWTSSDKPHSKRGWYRQVDKLAREDGLFVPHGRLQEEDPGSQHYRWLHRTIHEHLVGRRLMELVRDNPKEGLKRIRQAVARNMWREAIEHCAGFVSDAGVHRLVVDNLFAYRSGIKPLDDLVVSALVTFVFCSGSEYRRGELLEILVEAEDWHSANELDSGEFVNRVKDIDTAKLSDWGATQLAWKVADRGEMELMERLVARVNESASDADGVTLDYYRALHRREPTKAQLLSTEAYRQQLTAALPTPLMVGADLEVVEALCTAIREDASSYDVSVYLDALAKTGHARARATLENSLRRTLHGELYLEMYDVLQPTGAFKNATIALEVKRFSPVLLTKILCAEAPPYTAFSYAFSLPAHAEQQASLSPWARAGYWAGVFANLLDKQVEGHWSKERSAVAIDRLLRSSDMPTGEVVAEFYQAVIWSAKSKNEDLIPDISTIGARGDYRKERWNWWIWDMFLHALSDWLKDSDWMIVFDAWKTWNIEYNGTVDLDKILGRQASDDIDECLRTVLMWYVHEAPPTAHFPHYLPPIVIENIHEKAMMLLSALSDCDASPKADSLLGASTMWMQVADTLPTSWKSVKAAGRTIDSQRC